VYAFVRLNWVSVLPVFVSLLLGPLLAVGIIAICQIYFDMYVVIGLITIYAINALFVINLVGVINNQWLRKQIFTSQDLRKVIDLEFKNAILFYIKMYAITLIAFLIMLLFCSTSLV
jgi:hypothetical protein